MKKYILIGDINFNNRVDIEGMEGATFESTEHALQHIDQSPDEYYSTQKSNSKCVALSDFCEIVNNEEFWDGGSWITYINIK